MTRFSAEVTDASARSIILPKACVKKVSIMEVNDTCLGTPVPCVKFVHVDFLGPPIVGRCVELDSKGRLKYAPPHSKKQLDVVRVLCATDVAMVRASASLRPAIPQQIMNVFMFFQQCCRADYDVAIEGKFQLRCRACTQKLAHSVVVTCPPCGTALHPACADRVSRQFSSDEAFGVAVKPKSMGKEINSIIGSEMLCACCTKVLQLAQ